MSTLALRSRMNLLKWITNNSTSDVLSFKTISSETKATEFWVTVSAGHDRPELMPKDLCYLFPASSFWNRSRAKIKSFPRPPKYPSGARVAADSGGFVATFKWKGKYPYTPAKYVDWLFEWVPEWAAMMDYCCEPPIAGSKRKIKHRQKQTLKMAWLIWEKYGNCPWYWVPTIQGWETEDYINHAITMKPLLLEMQKRYSSLMRVGIGTLCARASIQQILEIKEAVKEILPGFQFHLWGVKARANVALQSPEVMSFDSAAWDGLAGARSRAIWQNEYRGKITQREYCYTIALPKYLKFLKDRGLNISIGKDCC